MEEKRRYDTYGLIRFLMAIMIAISHYNITLGGNGPADSGIIKTFYDICIQYGTCLPICFFVLSGFYIYMGYYERIVTGKISFADYRF